ncbi:pentapeptide repeat-containing protein [Desulfoluna butyratoxydans]|uniref:Pentapeptide repeat n=1 Tax=Desulfoluna butyratoxydans TaxID=231438 RepID=A0A4U8YZS6_9BACT|nr:pentapeptide repeat-containing protein [Desulfoluna butyratoxydans]VFQ47443.1 pentapeptide repeat [Desulfoluna butyratoxydans]
MPISKHIEIWKKGAKEWNKWRDLNPDISPDLSDSNFLSDLYDSEYLYDLPEYNGYNLSNCNLNRVSLRNCVFCDCNFSKSDFHYSDLVDSYCYNCDFSFAQLQVSKIGSAKFQNCNFEGANLSYCSAEETDFSGSKLFATTLNNMSLVKTNFSNTTIEQVRVYGISAWDLNLEGCNQSNIYIEKDHSAITVPTIELAQFIALLVNSSKIRDIIDTITSKVVLILGRFSSDRKKILDQIKNEIQTYGYLPVIFDFDGPENRDVTETIITLASMAKFVIADISSPKSIPQELSHIIPHFPSLPIQPIIEMSQREYGMFEHFERYPWVLDKITYSEEDLKTIVKQIVKNCDKSKN